MYSAPGNRSPRVQKIRSINRPQSPGQEFGADDVGHDDSADNGIDDNSNKRRIQRVIFGSFLNSNPG